MGNWFKNVQPAIKDETKKLATAVAVMAAIMIGAFFVLHLFMPDIVPFDYTVVLAGVIGSVVAVLNFFLMGITVQEVVGSKSEDSARNQMKASYIYRMLMQMLWVALAVIVPVFNMVAGIIPIFFPGIWFKIHAVKEM